jgi:mono/diheme cytochrome c family protein
MKSRTRPSRRFRGPVWALLLLTLAGCDEILPKRTVGEKLYRKHCSDCHAADGAGQTIRSMGETYADLLDDTWRYAGDAPGIRTVLSQDLVFDHPTFSQKLSSEEIKQITEHVLTLRGERSR